MEKFYNKIEYYMSISIFAATTKQELNTMLIKPSKSVNEYYYWLFKLWQQAKTLKNEKVDKFKLILKLLILQLLLAIKYTNIKDLLNAAWSIKNQKKKISMNFFRDSKPPQKFFRQ